MCIAQCRISESGGEMAGQAPPPEKEKLIEALKAMKLEMDKNNAAANETLESQRPAYD